jgi:hypothetical protein
MMRRWFGSADLQDKVVYIAVEPVFARLERADDRMKARAEMLGGVLVLGAVAASDVSAGLAHSQVHPGVAHLQAFLTTIAARYDIVNVIKVSASRRHYLLIVTSPRIQIGSVDGYDS